MLPAAFGFVRRWPSAGICLLLLVAHASASAQTTSDDLARRHFESGAAYLEESDYDNALQAFQKAYDLSKRPEILLNIATVQERKGAFAEAVSALKQFSSVAPPGDPHLDATKVRIENLEKRIADAARTKPALAPVAPAGPAAASAEKLRVTPEEPSPEGHSSRLPAFVALGVGGAAVGGAVITGILAKAKYDDAKGSCSPACSDDQLSSTRSLALTSTILTGVAIVGVGVGVTLLLTSHPAPARTSYLPRLRLGAAPGAARAEASWRF